MDIGLSDPWILLTIKAPNQQIDDQIIKCKLDWSVAKLKGYIHETYPNKPKTEDQRLIYSGQLLTDSVILKDILRPYDEEGQLNRTVHLVCASSSCCVPPKEKIKTENEVQKKCLKFKEEINYGASTSGIKIPSVASCSQGTSSSSNNNHETKPVQNETKPNDNNVNNVTLNPQQIAAQQIMWLNRMYAIQQAEYWKSVASSLGAPVQLSTTQNINNEPSQDLPNNNNNNNQPADQNDEVDNNANRNIPNAAAPNQDWLDWLYVSSRVFIFISVLYFYSSPGRFIVVAGFALLLYLYQSGILRHIHEHNRRRFQPPEPQEQHVDNNRNLPEEQNENINDPAVNQSDRLITTLWTVISTFFTSLIPQQPDII